jgi:membrane associated rhomboid family serine protease
MRNTWGGVTFGGTGGWLPFSFHGTPAVRGLLIASAALFLAFFFGGQSSGPVAQWLPFVADPASLRWLTRPWTWVAHPLVQTGFVGLLLQGFWLYVVGGTLERSWGWRRFLPYFFTLAVISCLAFVPAAYLSGAAIPLAGLTLVNSALTVTWAALDPEQELLIYAVLPVKLKLIALVDVLFVYFTYGQMLGPALALVTFVGPIAAWFYIRRRVSFSFGSPFGRRSAPRREPLLREPLLREEPAPRRGDPPPRERVTRNPLRRKQEQEEIERLRKLLGEDDEGSPRRR